MRLRSRHCTLLITAPVLSPPYPRISVVTWEPIYLRIPSHNDFRATKFARESSAFISAFYIHLLQFNLIMLVSFLS